MKQFYLNTMGCQMNDHDSEVIRGLLLSLGYGETDRVGQADLILYNTCCVRANPERKVYGHITSYRRLKEKNPQLIIGICGCMPQQKQELAKILEQLPHVDLIFGTHNIHRLPELLERAQNGERAVEIWDEAQYDEGQDFRDSLPIARGHGLKAFVNVIYGCTNFCTYCIVPYVRGREHSRLPEKIKEDVQNLIQDGYKEITLLGQNVNAYGKDLSNKMSFAALLKELDRLEGLERIRFMTSHPRDMGQDLIEALSTLDTVCEHLHLPVQSGSSRILRRMNRGYSREYYQDLVRRIRGMTPEISLTTDIIVGFPGETEEDFAATLSLVEETQFDSAFTFIYSPREGTPATRLPEQIPEEIKKKRIYKLIELQNSISAKKMQKLLGTQQEILIEGRSREGLVGRTRTNRLVHLDGPLDLVGSLLKVEITEASTWSLRGRIC
ncbi:MAG: tRNA (N6-isopentenyl adenosine(37)-C2)-methylthiotransferase MiaB [Firmicutes bacterium]|nr:tRNA (N6-isopentenyl adenosine(37)-C2)-methylthiotransferase MiaB [Bacillota bacterium]